MARGPSFQKRKVVEHFSNLEIYNLLASKSSSSLLFLFYNYRCIYIYNIAFVNLECWLVKSCVYITQWKHEKFPAACKHGNFSYPSGFWHRYHKTNIKHFFRIDIQLYQHSWNAGKFEMKTLHPSGVVFTYNFSYIHAENVLYLLNIVCCCKPSIKSS